MNERKTMTAFNDPDIPDFAALSEAERLCDERIRAMSGIEKIMRTMDMFDFMRRSLSHQIEQEDPGLSPREIRLRVSERMYCADPRALESLKLMRRS